MPMVAEGDLAAIERAAVAGWPALEQARIDGWIARASSGGSVRGNSVAALDYGGGDVAASIAAVVSFYRARRLTPTFTLSSVSQPAGLDAELAARGWLRSGDHVTMAKPAASPATRASPVGIVVAHHAGPSVEWMEVYLQGLSANRRGAAPTLVAGVPAPRRFFAARREGCVIASGLSVVDGAWASVQCMATRADARRSGAATAILDAISAYGLEAGARGLYLQADRDNAAAIALYERAGFSMAGRYHTRFLPGG